MIALSHTQMCINIYIYIYIYITVCDGATDLCLLPTSACRRVPGVRMEEFLYEKLDRTAPQRPSSGQLLGRHMEDAARSFGPEMAYGERRRGAPSIAFRSL